MVAQGSAAIRAYSQLLFAKIQTTMIKSSIPKKSECVAVFTSRIAARNAKPPKSSRTTAAAATLAVVAGFNV